MLSIEDMIRTAKNPFIETSVGDPFSKIIDVIEINKHVSDTILQTLQDTRFSYHSSLILVLGEPGQGKTHLLSRLRQYSLKHDYIFATVRPIGDIKRIYSHILQEIMISLRKRTHPSDPYTPLEYLLGHIISDALVNGALPASQTSRELIREFQQNRMKIFEYPPEQLYAKNLIRIAFNYLVSQYPDINIQFLEVLFLTLDPLLKPLALKWLQGTEMSEDDLQKLGVTDCLDTEEEAFQGIVALSRLSNRPILLSFDQLESVYVRFRDEHGIEKIFDALTNIYNSCKNMVILCMIQSEVWNNVIKDNIPEYARHRIDWITTLEYLTPHTAELLVEARLATIFPHDSDPRPYKTYPFPRAVITQLVDRVKVPRLFLRVLRDLFNQVKMKSPIQEVTPEDLEKILGQSLFTGSAASTTPMKTTYTTSNRITATPSTALESDIMSGTTESKEEFTIAESFSGKTPSKEQIYQFLQKQMEKFMSEFEVEIFAFPYGIRRDFIKGILYEILKSARDLHKNLFGFKIKAVYIDREIKSGMPPLDIVFVFESSKGPISVGIELNYSEKSSTIYHTLRRLKNYTNMGLHYVFLIRDHELALKATATKSLGLAATLSEYGGLRYADFESSKMLIGAKKLIDKASASDLMLHHYIIKRTDVISYLFEHVIHNVPLLKTIFESFEAEQSPSSELANTILSLLNVNPSFRIRDLALLLNKSPDDLHAPLQELVEKGLISINNQVIRKR